MAQQRVNQNCYKQ